LDYNPHQDEKITYLMEALDQELFQEAIEKINAEEYRDAILVIKGCGNIPMPT
jgi:hypothetical protein